jgi:hypothetical protein
MADENANKEGLPGQQPLPLGGGKPPEPSASDLRAAALEAELNKIKSEQAKKSKDEEDAKKKAEEAKAIQEGETQKVLAQRNAELESEKKRREELETLERARIDKIVASLPENSRKKLETLKDSLSLPKYSELVGLEAEDAKIGISQPFAQPGRQKNNTMPDWDPESVKQMKKLGIDPAKTAGVEKVYHDMAQNKSKYVMPIDNLITAFKLNSAHGNKLSSEEYQKRMSKV